MNPGAMACVVDGISRLLDGAINGQEGMSIAGGHRRAEMTLANDSIAGIRGGELAILIRAG